MDKEFNMLVEKTRDGYSAYSVKANAVVFTVAATLDELKVNIVEALSLHAEREVSLQEVKLEFDFASWFEYSGTINVKGLAAYIGMNTSLLAQYIAGIKKPSRKQKERIADGIHALAKELAAVSFA